jgi:hypothetical protein
MRDAYAFSFSSSRISWPVNLVFTFYKSKKASVAGGSNALKLAGGIRLMRFREIFRRPDFD